MAERFDGIVIGTGQAGPPHPIVETPGARKKI